MFSLSSEILGIIISFAPNRHGVNKAPSKPETMSAFVTESDLNGIGIRVVRRYVTDSEHSKLGHVWSHLNTKHERGVKEWVKIVLRKRQLMWEILLINVNLQFQLKLVGYCLSKNNKNVLFYC